MHSPTEIAAAAAHEPAETYQQRVDAWLLACFGETIARDKRERDHRLLEEALETVQSGQCTRSEAHQLVDYVFDRPVGERKQEVGGIMNTLAAWCLAYDIDLNEAAEAELARVWTKVEKIRAKQAAKPKHSPLPEAAAPHLAGWRAIASAPKTGEIIWAWLNQSGIRAVRWCLPEERAIEWSGSSKEADQFDAAWCETDDIMEELEPKWWLPYDALPPPPEPDADSREGA